VLITLFEERARDGFSEAEIEKRGQVKIFHAAKSRGFLPTRVAGGLKTPRVVWAANEWDREVRRAESHLVFVHAARRRPKGRLR
jgi:hypothetical protein